MRRPASPAPKLLVTGFGPFPGAPENPTEALVRALGRERQEAFGASALRAVVLPTDYKKSLAKLRRLTERFAPDVVVHFGLNNKATAILVERVARNSADPHTPDAAGYAPRLGRARRSGPDRVDATLPAEPIVAALNKAGHKASASDNAGAYVCNAMLYNSLVNAPRGRLVGFVHVPPCRRSGKTAERLDDAARIILRTALAAWRNNARRSFR